MGSAIQATEMLEFEDGLRTGFLHGGCWCYCDDCIKARSIPMPPWGAGCSWGQCSCHSSRKGGMLLLIISCLHVERARCCLANARLVRY